MFQHLITHGEDLRMVPTDHDQLTTAVQNLREELQALPEGADTARARVLARWTGIGLLSLGDYDDARVYLRRALDLATASGNTRAVIAIELNLADAYRYAGEAENADVLCRSALDSTRGGHPELVDFALQHPGKHFMEQGSLIPARAHLQEALRLRTAKHDAGLVESTQAALACVELPISHASADTTAPAGGDTEAAQWSRRWTSWLQSRTNARTPAGRDEGSPFSGTPYAISPRTNGYTPATCVNSHSSPSCSPAEAGGALSAELSWCERGAGQGGCWPARGCRGRRRRRSRCRA